MNNDLYYVVAQNIKRQRKLKGWTQVKLSLKSGVSYDYLKKIETKSGCTKQFSLYTVQKIAEALDIDVRLLFTPLDVELIEEVIAK